MRRWLSIYALSITSIVVIAFLVPLAVLVRDLATDRAMNAAEREAQTIARFASTVDNEPSALSTLEATLGAARSSSVRLSDGAVLGAPMPQGIDLTAAIELGQAYRQPLDRAEAVVVPVLRANDAHWIVVVKVVESELTRGVVSAWLVLGGLGVALVLLASIIADRMGRAVVKPMDDLIDATKRLGKGELTVEVEPAGPGEMAAVGRAFNSLTGKVGMLMERERETAADLSHRLRTPMTALKLDVEALADEADVSRLHDDIDELERVVSHVIREARRPASAGESATADLAAVVRERAEFWGTLGSDQARPWSVDVPDGSWLVRSSHQDLEAMLDAVLGNVFAHTEPGIAWDVSLAVAGADCLLVIADKGGGILDRGFLDRGESGGSSTGLGIDIVRRIAAAAGGSADWQPGAIGGTVVTISLPLAAGARR